MKNVYSILILPITSLKDTHRILRQGCLYKLYCTCWCYLAKRLHSSGEASFLTLSSKTRFAHLTATTSHAALCYSAAVGVGFSAKFYCICSSAKIIGLRCCKHACIYASIHTCIYAGCTYNLYNYVYTYVPN